MVQYNPRHRNPSWRIEECGKGQIRNENLSCPFDTVYYGKNGTQLLLRDHSKCILENVMRLSWKEGMEYYREMCPWAGSLYAALKYMGESYTYDQIMGMSGACYRICFTSVWDYSCTDALVTLDYATPLYNAVGYSCRAVERLEKRERKAERLAAGTASAWENFKLNIRLNR